MLANSSVYEIRNVLENQGSKEVKMTIIYTDIPKREAVAVNNPAYMLWGW
jgi:hypothetical protein